jgi:AcrR family transcriptional regulator
MWIRQGVRETIANVSPTTRPYGGIPAQQRHARRRAALLEAGLDLLGTGGWAATTMRAVCRQAGLNDRYFYENFAGTDALLLAVVDDLAAQGTAAILAAAQAAPRDLPAGARAAVTAAVDFLTADPRRARILAYEIQACPLLQDRRRTILHALAAIYTTQIHELQDEILASAADVELAGYTIAAGSWELIVSWIRGDLATDRAHLIDFIVALILTSADLAPALHRQLQRAPR